MGEEMAEHLDQYYCDTELRLMTPASCRARRSSSPSGSSIGTAACSREGTGKATHRQEQQQRIVMLHGDHMISDHGQREIQERSCSGKQLSIGASDKAKHDHQRSSAAAGRRMLQLSTSTSTHPSVIPWSSVPSSHMMSSSAESQLANYTAGSNPSNNRSLQRFLQKRKKRAAYLHPYLPPPPP